MPQEVRGVIPVDLNRRLRLGRIELRPVEPTDLWVLAEQYATDPDRWAGRWEGATPSPERVGGLIETLEGPAYVVSTVDDEVRGLVVAYRLDPVTRLAMVAIEIAHPWRRGHTAAFAAGCFIDHLIEDIGVEHIRVEVADFNIALLGSALDAFELEACLPGYIQSADGTHDVSVYALSAERWRETWGRRLQRRRQRLVASQLAGHHPPRLGER